MELVVNGEKVVAEPREGQSLLELLRDDLGVRSVKDGCAPEGSCGACTVLVDGRAVVSCAQKATRVEGKHVVTQEGLSADERELWARSFVTAGASQCGYCSPGIVMKAEALLRRVPAPSRAAILRALAGNLCRCTGYQPIVRAVRAAAVDAPPARGKPSVASPGFRVVGTRPPRVDGAEKVTGRALFGADIVMNIISAGLSLWNDSLNAPEGEATIPTLLFLVLAVWSIDVAGFILSRALERPYALGVAIMLAYVLLSISIRATLFPATV